MLRISTQLFAFLFTFVMGAFSNSAVAAEKVYDLEIKMETVTKGGVTLENAMTINGQIPGPTLEFDEGDTAVIRVKNSSQEMTSLHWHGVLVPWGMDGPSFANNLPIHPGETFVFHFPLKQSGTYWYHSHSMLQEQQGLYGAFIIHPKNKKSEFAAEKVLVLSDWSHEDGMQILKNLKKDGDYYAYKKNFFPSWVGAIRQGAVWDYI